MGKSQNGAFPVGEFQNGTCKWGISQNGTAKTVGNIKNGTVNFETLKMGLLQKEKNNGFIKIVMIATN